MASEGAAQQDVFATASWTLPSHASMFTGLMPRTLGLGQAPGGTAAGARAVLEARRDQMLPEVLRRAGYATAGVSTNLWIADYSGFATGFDAFHLVDGGPPQSGGRGLRRLPPRLRPLPSGRRRPPPTPARQRTGGSPPGDGGGSAKGGGRRPPRSRSDRQGMDPPGAPAVLLVRESLRVSL